MKKLLFAVIVLLGVNQMSVAGALNVCCTAQLKSLNNCKNNAVRTTTGINPCGSLQLAYNRCMASCN